MWAKISKAKMRSPDAFMQKHIGVHSKTGANTVLCNNKQPVAFIPFKLNETLDPQEHRLFFPPYVFH